MAQGQQQKKSNGKYWCKVFQTKNEIVCAICDKDLLDKTLNDKKLNVSVNVSKHFYGGALINDMDALKTMSEATIGNIIGKDIANLATKNGFITKENTILIDGIPHAQFIKN